MCRWNAYVGQPLLMGELLYRTQHGLIDESLHSRMGAETTNGDGFGVGWYGIRDRATPARYRSVNPAWNDANMRELGDHVETPLFLAHIRAAIGSPVQQTNCHPFRHDRWLFVHTALSTAFTPYGVIWCWRWTQRSSTTSRVPRTRAGFHLALTLGLEQDPLDAMGARAGHVESKARERGVEIPCRATSASATANDCGPSATRQSTRAALSSSRPTSRRCNVSIPRTSSCSN